MSLDPNFKSAATIELHIFPSVSREWRVTECPNCESPLALLQPDSELPDRLIGACLRCKHWYLIDTVTELNNGVLVRLPDEQVIRSLTQKNWSSGISLLSSDVGCTQKGESDQAN
jgi:hypothetical protein